MANPLHREDVARQILSSLHQYDSFLDAARHLHRTMEGEFSSQTAAESYLRRLREKVFDDSERVTEAPDNETDYEEGRDSAKFNFKGSLDKPITVEELIRIHGVDTERFEIAKIRVKAWGVTAKIKNYQKVSEEKTIPIGQHLEAGKNYSISVDLEKKKETAAALVEASMDQILDSVRNIHKTNKAIKPSPAFRSGGAGGKRMLELSIFDLHLGKLCWSEETGGADWDTKIASSLALEAAKDLLDFFPDYERIWLPLGHDFFNSDGPGDGGSGGRTFRGTSQDEDTRWAKSFNTGVDLALALVELCNQYAPVDITIMRGNHDEERCTYMGRLLAEVYRHHKHISVDHVKQNLKAYQWGEVFLATCHGQLEKEQKVVTECALKFPEMFSSSKWREIHVGHGHRMKNAGMVLDGWEEQSVRWRMIPSLCERDDYHSSNLYHNHPAAECYLWHKTDHYDGHHSFTNCS